MGQKVDPRGFRTGIVKGWISEYFAPTKAKSAEYMVQDLKVRILNLVGEELINEDLQQFIGEYTKQIDLSNNAKGIYFLEIETDNGVINKKLLLQ